MSLFEELTLKQKNLGLVLETPLGEDYLLIRRMAAEEALSQPFHISLGMISEHLDIDPTDILGKPVTVTLHPLPKQEDDSLLGAAAGALMGGGDEGPEDRYFHGIVTSFQIGAAVIDAHGGKGGFRAYHAEVIPRLGMLEYASNCRIFQEKSVVEIIEAVLQDHGLSSGTDYSVSDVSGPLTTRKWDYCVQYNESDLSFLSRLMEATGIYYYFEHEESSHKLVLTDEESLSVKTHEMLFRTSSRATYDPKELMSWENRFHFHSGKVALSDFDYRNTASDLLSSVTTSKGHADTKEYEWYQYPVLYQTTRQDTYGTKSDGGKLATIQMQVLDSKRHQIQSSSHFRELQPGHLIKLKEQKRSKGKEDEEGQKFLVLSVSHEMQQEAITAGARTGILTYSNSFTCMPGSIPFSPPRVTSKPRMPGPQTAIVIGASAFSASDKADQEVMTDKYGRVKVQFHWDRRSGDGETKYENSSCWIRVSQGHAGAGWGMIHIPRKGEEVVVDFLDGDPDQPIITGRVYNAQNKLPYPLDDMAKADNIYISGYKSRSSLNGDVAKNYNELTFQDKKGKEQIYFRAEKDFVRVVENRDVLIVSDKMHVSDGRIQQVLDDTKDGSQTIEIYKHRTATIQTGDDKLEVTEGDRIIEIKKGEHKLDVAKDITITSAKNISVEAKNDKIELVVGLSSITMKNDGTITIKGKAITLDGMQSVTAKGLQYEATGQTTAKLVGSAVAQVNGSAMAKVTGGVTMIN
jgi:type VI secretion system secreted protein VgrG